LSAFRGVGGAFRVSLRVIRGGQGVLGGGRGLHFVLEPAQVELRSGRV